MKKYNRQKYCGRCWNLVDFCDCIHYDETFHLNPDIVPYVPEPTVQEKGECLRFFHPTEKEWAWSPTPPTYKENAAFPVPENSVRDDSWTHDYQAYPYTFKDHQYWPVVQYNSSKRWKDFYAAEVTLIFENGTMEHRIYYFEDRPRMDDIGHAIKTNVEPAAVYDKWTDRNEGDWAKHFYQGIRGNRPFQDGDENGQDTPPEVTPPPQLLEFTKPTPQAFPPDEEVDDEEKRGGKGKKPIIYNTVPNVAIPIGLVGTYVFNRPNNALTPTLAASMLKTIQVRYSQPAPAGNGEEIRPTKCEVHYPPHEAGTELGYQDYWLLCICSNNFTQETVTMKVTWELGGSMIMQLEGRPGEITIGSGAAVGFNYVFTGKNAGINYFSVRFRTGASPVETRFRIDVTGNWDPSVKYLNTDVTKGFIAANGLPPQYAEIAPGKGQKFIFSAGNNQNRRYFMTVPPTLPVNRFPDILYALNTPYIGIKDGNSVNNSFHGPSGQGKYRLVFLTDPRQNTPDQVYEVGHASGVFGEIYGRVVNN